MCCKCGSKEVYFEHGATRLCARCWQHASATPPPVFPEPPEGCTSEVEQQQDGSWSAFYYPPSCTTPEAKARLKKKLRAAMKQLELQPPGQVLVPPTPHEHKDPHVTFCGIPILHHPDLSNPGPLVPLTSHEAKAAPPRPLLRPGPGYFYVTAVGIESGIVHVFCPHATHVLQTPWGWWLQAMEQHYVSRAVLERARCTIPECCRRSKP